MSAHELTVLFISLTSLMLSCTHLIRIVRENRQRRLNRPRCSACGRQAILWTRYPDTGDQSDDLYCEKCVKDV